MPKTSKTKIIEWIEYLVDNWYLIPRKYKSNISPHRKDTEYGSVILLLSRQKPSIEPSYNFDEERIALNKHGKIIWGFDSGCSCPTPWGDSFPNCYNISNGWKAFEINLADFDEGALAEARTVLMEVYKATVKCVEKVEENEKQIRSIQCNASTGSYTFLERLK